LDGKNDQKWIGFTHHSTKQNYCQKVEDLVEEILKAKEKNTGADTSALEQEIDRMVYRLYELTPEEMGIVGKWKILEKGLKVLQVEFCY